MMHDNTAGQAALQNDLTEQVLVFIEVETGVSREELGPQTTLWDLGFYADTAYEIIERFVRDFAIAPLTLSQEKDLRREFGSENDFLKGQAVLALGAGLLLLTGVPW